MPPRLQKVVALIPCYNEESGIAEVIRSFPIDTLRTYGYELTLLVVDNNSSDNTAAVARSVGATVIAEPKQGKGNAMRSGFSAVPDDTDYVVMLDGDTTYRPEEIIRMLEPLSSDFCDVVVGSRLGGRMRDGAMRPLNRMGNWIYSHLVRALYRVNVTDVLTGYFAWKRESLLRLRPHLTSTGFAIEMEMITKMAKLGEHMYSVPISYYPRKGTSTLRPFYDGTRILWMCLRNLFWYPPRAKVQRIVFVSDAVMPYFNGGKEKRLYEISRRLVKKGREVHIYTMKWWEGPPTIEHEGVYYHSIMGLLPLYNGERRSMLQAIFFGLATFKMLFKKFDVLDVDQMPYFPLFSAYVVTRLRNKKLYGTWHEVWDQSYWIEYMKGPLGYIGYFVEKLSWHMPDIIIANSKHTKDRLLAAGVSKEIMVVPLGVELDDIYAAKAAEVPSDVIFVGRLIDHKNVDLLVRAIARVKTTVPGIVCHIVGEGPEKYKIIQLIHELGLESEITVFDLVKSHSELYGLMKASKMLVLPSIREGFGLVAIEANAAGLPVITSSHRNNATKDLIREGVNGFVVEPTAEGIAEKIIQLLAQRESMQPRLEIEQHDWGIVVEHMEKAFVKI